MRNQSMQVDTIYSEAMEIADRSNGSILDSLVQHLVDKTKKVGSKFDPSIHKDGWSIQKIYTFMAQDLTIDNFNFWCEYMNAYTAPEDCIKVLRTLSRAFGPHMARILTNNEIFNAFSKKWLKELCKPVNNYDDEYDEVLGKPKTKHTTGMFK